MSRHWNCTLISLKMLYSWFINELDILNLFSVGRDGVFLLSYCLIVLFFAYLQKKIKAATEQQIK